MSRTDENLAHWTAGYSTWSKDSAEFSGDIVDPGTYLQFINIYLLYHLFLTTVSFMT